MRLFIVGVVVLAACGETRQVARWPNHRRDKDAQIEMLTQQAQKLEQRITVLEQTLWKLQQGQQGKPAAETAAPRASAER